MLYQDQQETVGLLIRRWDSERELFYDDIFNSIYAVRRAPGTSGSCRIRWNNAK